MIKMIKLLIGYINNVINNVIYYVIIVKNLKKISKNINFF